METPDDFTKKQNKQSSLIVKKKALAHMQQSQALAGIIAAGVHENKKAFKNPSLQEKDEAKDNESSEVVPHNLQNLFRNMKISADTTKVVSEELMKHKNTKWTDLGVSSKTCAILEYFGFKFPSPVQYTSINNIIKGHDILVRAKNGSGKTLSFVIPIIERIDISKNTLQAIIVVPIRELALQIARISRALCKELDIKSTPLVGGSDLADDIIRVSSGVHLLIGTPGRIVDVLERNLCKIDEKPLIIFDEADKLLDAIFFESIFRLMAIIPSKKQLCLYSATFPDSTKSFVNMNMRKPEYIKISEEYTLYNVSLFYAKITASTKLPCLNSLLKSMDIDQCIIYCNHIENVQILAEKITEMGFSCYFIHSKMHQTERNTVFHNFSKNKCKILVSTDITTRGTDVQGVNTVINFDIPVSSESFLHRQGRAGRFGIKGCCLTLLYESEVELIEQFARFVGSDISPCSAPEFKNFCKN